MTRTFREKVIEAQQSLGLSNKELSRRSGVSYDVVRELHRRPDSTTGAENAIKLMRALGLDEDGRKPVAVASGDLVPIFDIEAGLEAGSSSMVSIARLRSRFRRAISGKLLASIRAT